MTAETVSHLHLASRFWYRRLMARQFGIVRPDLRSGRRPKWLIDCFLDGKRYKLRGYITRGGKRIRFSDEEAAIHCNASNFEYFH